nr:receptor-like serine/threonine-protein kinase SD1-8 [Ziziphus jujuba var. spinosa]
MKLGWDLKTGLQRRLVSWKSSDDPSPGDLTWEIDINNYPESVMFRGSEKYYRGGPWNGLRFSGAPELKPNPLFKFEFVFNEDEVYYTYNLLNNSAKSRIVVNQTNGYTRDRYAWNSVTQSWDVFATVPRDKCDKYALCGAYGNCIIGESPVCQCLEGFKPKGNLMDRSQGCIRNKPFNCQDKDSSGFLKFRSLKLPETAYSWVNESLNLKECKAKCWSNCSCTAYANSDIRGGGSGCVMWFGDLIDIREFQAGGQDLYVRMHASEFKNEAYCVDSCASFASHCCGVWGVLGCSLHPQKKNALKAWKLWKEGRPLELISPILSDSSNLSKELDSIHVGLLCVQEHPEDRSSMSYVVFMLGCDNALPEPKQPGFSLGKDNVAGDSSSNKLESSSTNEITVTLLELR